MSISDLLTLLGIILAIFAFLSEKNREYVFLKFSKTNYIILIGIFSFLHFLLSYDWWKEKVTWLSMFESDNSPTPSAWAYLISIATLFWATRKIFFGKFPNENLNSVLKYYEKLLQRNDLSSLSELIEKYHLSDIVSYLKARKSIVLKNATGFWQLDREEYSKAYNKVINKSNLIYAGHVIGRIIKNDTFIDGVSNTNPYLFSTIIAEMNSIEVKDDEFVNRFLKILMINKNSNFFREIKNNQNLGEFDAYAIEDSRPILFSLFNDVHVASINQAWRGIGEQAILEIEEESKRDYSALRESDNEQENDTTWTFRMTIAIWYFDIMVRQAIKQKVNDHMWMFYYVHFTEALLTNMKDLPFANSEQNRQSRNFDLLQDIITKMMDWKDVSVSCNNDNLLDSIYDCMGRCLYEILLSNKLNQKDKHYLLNWVWEDLIKTFPEKEEQQATVDKVIVRGFKMFKEPSMLFSVEYHPVEAQKYINELNHLWNERDTPILTGIVGQRANKFKTEIIDSFDNQ